MNMLCTTILLLQLTVLAPGAAEGRFEEARNLFLYQECDRAMAILAELLYPEVRLGDQAKELKAREYLGACLYWAKRRAEADREFTAILVKAPAAELDPFYYPVEMIQHLDELRGRLIAQGVIDDPRAPPPEKNDPAGEPKIVERLKIVHERSLLPVFLPMGVPQFYNDEPVSGILFATGQGLALTANVTSYLMIEFMRRPDGYIASGDIGTARALQGVLYTSAGVFGALYLWSVIDGLVDHRGEWVEERAPALGVTSTAGGAPMVFARWRFH